MFAVLSHIGVFLSNFLAALKLSLFDFDAHLKITKTPRQRLAIWLAILVITVLGVWLLLLLIGHEVRPFLQFNQASPQQ